MESKKSDNQYNGAKKTYDVFISYRRKNTETARNLEQALKLRGLNVFFDMEELDDGKFNERIYEAIDQSKNAILLMTKGALDRCEREGDWVRIELERILKRGINLILVCPSDVEVSFPDGLPLSISGIKYIEVTELHPGKMFPDSVTRIIKRLKGVKVAKQRGADDLPVLGKPVDEVSLTGLKGQDAQHFKKALGYYNVLRYRSALNEFRKIEAMQNTIVHYYVMRLAYELEGGISEQGFEDSCIAARDCGCTDAMRIFADMHLSNEDEIFDPVLPTECVDWLKKAIALGNADALTSLGTAYENGRGVVESRKKARELHKQSSDAGSLLGKIDYGSDCLDGVEAGDLATAGKLLRPVVAHLLRYENELTSLGNSVLLMWYSPLNPIGRQDYSLVERYGNRIIGSKGRSIASDAFFRRIAYSCLGDMYLKNADTLEKSKLAFECYRKAHEIGDADGSIDMCIAVCYENGIGVDIDKKAALAHYESAAGKGWVAAQRALGIHLLEDGDSKDVDRGKRLLRQAAEGGDLEAMSKIGWAYLNGDGVNKDAMVAEKWFVKAAETGDADAECCLGTRYAQGAFGKIDYVKAKEWWEGAAEQDYLIAMWNLGDMYQRGEEGVPQDRQQAFYWFKRAAEAGSPDAMKSLGLAYLNGTGTIVDVAEAEKWLKKAARAENADAECSLGTRYAEGAFGERNMYEAIKWWKRAAEHGDAVAMQNLGVTYRDGDGVDKDLQKAEEWFVHAAGAGSGDAACTLGAAYYRGDFGEPDKKRALEWSLKAAKLGDATAMNNLGIMYRDGDGVEVDLRRAIGWFRRAADGGLPDAMINLGFAHLNGSGVPEDKAAAEELFVKAAGTGDADAEVSLGTRYAQGAFGKVDYPKAVEWWLKAARHGQMVAMWNLGDLYQRGEEGIEKDLAKSFNWFKESAEAGDARGMESLGLAYLGGLGTIADEEKAREWLIRSAELDNVSAICSMGTRFAQGAFGERDMCEAIKWWERAAEHGDTVAMQNLGATYRDGDGVDKDLQKAEEWFVRAAGAGSGDAACALGAAYYRGDFGEPDKKKALGWNLRAAKLGDTTAMNNLGAMYRDGDGVDVDLYRAVDWFRRAADGGLPDAMINLGFVYLDGSGVPEDKVAAEEWFVKAAETGDADAETSLGTRYAQGAFGKVDYPKAVEWWLKAARHEQMVAMWNLGDVYKRGEEGVEKDLAKSFDWFKESAEAGLPDAMESLGLAYLDGLGTIADEEKAKEWLIRAAENGNASAECTLGSLYARDDYWDKDMREAVKWWEKAAEHGYATAMYNLGYAYSDSDSEDAGIPLDLDKARGWFHQADENGNEDAACHLGLDVLGALGKRYETYTEWHADFHEAHSEKGPAARILRKAGSWFQKPLDARTGDMCLAGVCLRWLARIARYQEDIEEAKSLYQQAVENDDEEAKVELLEIDMSGCVIENTASVVKDEQSSIPVMQKTDEAVAIPVPKPRTRSSISAAQTVSAGDEASRAEALFLRKARRFKKNDGRIDKDEKGELCELAEVLGISAIRREELIEQVEEEFESEA